MSHDHAHAEERSTYLIDQVCTIAICGVLALVCVLLWCGKSYFPPRPPDQPMLNYLLKEGFHWTVLAGGVGLAVAVLIRALTVWPAARPAAADHEHEHGHGHQHDDCCGHDHCHEHDHAAAGHVHGDPGCCDHEHGFSPWRYMVLLLPVTLFFLGLPNRLPSEEAVNPEDLGKETATDQRPIFGIEVTPDPAGLRVVKLVKDSPPDVAGMRAGDVIEKVRREADVDDKPLARPEATDLAKLPLEKAEKLFEGPDFNRVVFVVRRDGAPQPLELTVDRNNVLMLDFKELDQAAYSPEKRKWFQGRFGMLRGQYAPSPNPKVFSLVRFKMACCAADAIPIKAVIEVPEEIRDIKPQEWIEVRGKIQFRQVKDRNEFVPVLRVRKTDDVRKIPPEPNLYIQ